MQRLLRVAGLAGAVAISDHDDWEQWGEPPTENLHMIYWVESDAHAERIITYLVTENATLPELEQDFQAGIVAVITDRDEWSANQRSFAWDATHTTIIEVEYPKPTDTDTPS